MGKELKDKDRKDEGAGGAASRTWYLSRFSGGFFYALNPKAFLQTKYSLLNV